MKIKINSMYAIAGGYIIPRSHFSETDVPAYAVVDLLIGGEIDYVKKPCTMTRQELKKAFGLNKNERIEII